MATTEGRVSVESVRVLLRVRPPNAREVESGYSKALACVGENVVEAKQGIGHTVSSKAFAFDAVADEDATQEEVFENVAKVIVDGTLEGYSSCIFAYGQTGAGKTYTMQGSDSADGRGLIPRVLEYLFHRIEEDRASASAEREEEVQYTCRCSYVEIYNETVSDLLNPSHELLTVRDDAKRGVFLEGVKEEQISSAAETYRVFMQGSENRHVGSTAMNRESSRSHSVFTVTVESKRWLMNAEEADRVISKRRSTLHLVDLAGSERQKHSEASGQTLKEATAINKSLSALGNVIKALSDISGGRDRIHIPYRDSKLTFLLKDALGGHSKCAMIANVSPAMRNLDETLSTLNFAQRVKLVTNRAALNEEAVGSVSALQLEIKKLSAQVAELRDAGHNSPELIAAKEELTERNLRLEGLLKEALFRASYAEETVSSQLSATTAKATSLQELTDKLENALQSQKMIVRLRDNTIRRLNEGKPMEVDSELTQVQEEVSLLKSQVDCHPDVVKYRMQIESLQRDMAALHRKLSERDATELNSSLARQMGEVLQLKADLSRQLDSARRHAMKLDEAKQAAEKRAHDVKHAFSAQTALQEELMGHLSTTTTERDVLGKRLKSAENTIVEYVAKLSTTSAAKDVVQAELADFKIRAEERTADLLSQISEAGARYEALENMRSALQNEMEILSKAHVALEQKLQEILREKEGVENSLHDAKTYIESSKAAHEDAIRQLNEKAVQQEQHLRREAASAVEKLSAEKNVMESELRSELEDQKQTLNKMICGLKEEHEAATTRLEMTFADEKENIVKTYEQQMHVREDQMKKDAAVREDALREESMQKQAESDAMLLKQQENHRQEICDVERKHADESIRNQEKWQKEVNDVETRFKSDMSHMEEKHQAETEILTKKHKSDLQEQEEKFRVDFACIEAKYLDERNALEDAFGTKQMALEEKFNSEKLRLREENFSNLEKAEQTHRENVSSLEKEHLEKEAAFEKLTAETRQKVEELEAEVVIQENAFISEKKALVEKFDGERVEIEKEFNGQLTSLKNEMSSLEEEYTIREDTLKDDLRKEKMELESLLKAEKAEIEQQLQSELSSMKEQSLKMEEKYRSENERLLQTHSAEQEHLTDLHRSEKMRVEEGFKAEISKMRDEILSMEESHKADNKQITESHDIQVGKLEGALASKAEEVQQLKEEKLQIMQNHEDQMASLDSEVGKRVAEREAELEDREERVRGIIEEHECAELRFKEAQTRLDDTLQRNAHLEEEISALKGLLNNAETRIHEVLSENANEVKSESEEIAHLQGKILEMDKSVAVLQGERDHALSSTADLWQQVESLQRELELTKTEDQDPGFAQETDEHIAKLEDARDAAERAAADSEVERVKLAQELEHAIKDRVQMTAKLEDSYNRFLAAEELTKDLQAKVLEQEAALAAAAQRVISQAQVTSSGKQGNEKSGKRGISVSPRSGSESDEVDEKSSGKRTTKRGRRPLGEMQPNEVERRPSRTKSKDIQEIVAPSAGRYSLRSSKRLRGEPVA